MAADTASNETLPSPRHLAAIQNLQAVEDATILAWLSIIRALEPGFQYASRLGGLSVESFEAVVSLVEVSDEVILQWLSASRNLCMCSR